MGNVQGVKNDSGFAVMWLCLFLLDEPKLRIVTNDCLVFTEPIPECDVEQWNKDVMQRRMISHSEPMDSITSPIINKSSYPDPSLNKYFLFYDLVLPIICHDLTSQ